MYIYIYIRRFVAVQRKGACCRSFLQASVMFLKPLRSSDRRFKHRLATSNTQALVILLQHVNIFIEGNYMYMWPHIHAYIYYTNN